MNDFLQSARVNITEGVPGGGKTERLVNALGEKLGKTPVSDVLCLSFTKEAARQVNSRMGYTERDKKRPARTIHSLALTEWSAQSKVKLEILDYGDKDKIYKELGISVRPPSIDEYGVIQARTDSEIDTAALAMFQLHDLTVATGWETRQVIQHYGLDYNGDLESYALRLLAAYQKLKKPGQVDFNDTLLKNMVRSKWKYVFIDEAQDLTWRQWQVVAKAAANAEEVFIYRDVNQSVFQWAGAQPKLLDKLLQGHPNVTYEMLHQSHRCCDAVAQAGNDVLVRMGNWAINPGWAGNGKGGFVHGCMDPNLHVEMLTRYLERQVSDGKSVLLMARTNDRMKWLRKKVRMAGFPIETIKGVEPDEPWAVAADAFKRLRDGGYADVADIRRMQKYSDYLASRKDLDTAKGLYSLAELFDGGPDNPIKFDTDTHAALRNRLNRFGTYLPKAGIRLSTIQSCKGDQADATIVDFTLGKKRVNEMFSNLQLRQFELPVGYVGITRARESTLMLGDHPGPNELCTEYGLKAGGYRSTTVDSEAEEA